MRTINSIINKLSQNKGVQSILLLDEIIPNARSEGSTQETFNMKGLDLSNSNIHILLAINPSPLDFGFNKRIKIIPPENKDTLAFQLLMKHRNGYLIAVFLEHYKLFYNRGCSLDSSQDMPLKEDNLPPGRCPVWIQRDKRITDESVLEQIKKDHVLEHESVTLLYWGSIKVDTSQWCYQNNWKCFDNGDFYGCEDQVIVAFDLVFLRPEIVSRAKNGLIILTTKV